MILAFTSEQDTLQQRQPVVDACCQAHANTCKHSTLLRIKLATLCRMCELLQSGEQSGERAQAANSLSALLSGGSRKRAEVRITPKTRPCNCRSCMLHVIQVCCRMAPHYPSCKQSASRDTGFALSRPDIQQEWTGVNTADLKVPLFLLLFLSTTFNTAASPYSSSIILIMLPLQAFMSTSVMLVSHAAACEGSEAERLPLMCCSCQVRTRWSSGTRQRSLAGCSHKGNTCAPGAAAGLC